MPLDALLAPNGPLALSAHEWVDARTYDAVRKVTRRIAHSLKNHVAIVNTFSELLEPSITKSLEAQEDFALLTQTYEKLDALTERMRLFSRNDKQTPLMSIALHPLLTQKAEELRAGVPAHTRIHTKWEATTDEAFITAAQFGCILQALCANAIEAMPAGGDLVMLTQEQEICEVACVSHGVTAGSYFVLMLKNTGDATTLESPMAWFEPLFSTKLKRDGFGLAEAYGFVRRAQGTIRICTAEGVGTSLAVYLPHKLTPSP